MLEYIASVVRKMSGSILALVTPIATRVIRNFCDCELSPSWLVVFLAPEQAKEIAYLTVIDRLRSNAFLVGWQNKREAPDPLLEDRTGWNVIFIVAEASKGFPQR